MKHYTQLIAMLIMTGVANVSYAQEDEPLNVIHPLAEGRTIVVQQGTPGPLSNQSPQQPGWKKSNQLSRFYDSQIQAERTRLDSLIEPDMIASIAKFSRLLFNALIKEGFTEKQALDIVGHIGIPGRK